MASMRRVEQLSVKRLGLHPHPHAARHFLFTAYGAASTEGLVLVCSGAIYGLEEMEKKEEEPLRHMTWPQTIGQVDVKLLISVSMYIVYPNGGYYFVQYCETRPIKGDSSIITVGVIQFRLLLIYFCL